MLKGFFKRTPTVEEFYDIVIKSLKAENIQMPDDTYLDEEVINGFQYIQKWKSPKYHMMFIACCNDVRIKNHEIKYYKERLP